MDGQGHTQGHFISFRPKADEEVPHVMGDPGAGNLTVGGASDWILSHTPTSYQVGPCEPNYVPTF
jgi:hypothetical protein